ncbi:MAG: AAA family ATPase [Candidatus Aenigmarchaeota archaeon]|nr:AAA family ATPase [Candidatus Aenigmarchaeota archaeon]
MSGSGKSAIAKELRKLGYKAYDVEEIEGLCQMFDKETGKPVIQDNEKLEEVKQNDWICNKKKLQQIIRKNSKGIVFYSGLVSNLDELFPLFDEVILLKATQKTLSKRLTTRTSNDFGRTREVQEWIFAWKKWWEDKMIKEGAIVIDADQELDKVVADIIKKIES